MFPPNQYLDLGHTAHHALFENVANCWEALDRIADYLKFRLQPGIHARLIGRPFVSSAVFVGRGSVIEQGAMIKGPAWIGEDCEIRAGCYIRENVIVGDGSVLGNSCEFKNCILFDEAEVPHFSYVGDSILGHKAHLGAGVILSNVRLDRGEISVKPDSGPIPTGRRKFGAVVGDRTEVGCNAVLSPGSILGRDCLVYPGTHWRGVLPHRSIARHRQQLDVVPRSR